MVQLQSLSLSRTKVTDAGLKHFKNLKRLRELYLDGTKVSDAGEDYLEQVLPKAKVTRR